ncbi:hypothetical protein DM813_22665 [Pseudomonas alkylphenolica]|uniref:RING-type E3 ubiquitin transferase n=1 Tax=Pseudomonas alkylphenolica TaxID=237609 RepID=A0A443ZJP1_9PSED|nr:DUF6543 domain-containing protein [Pseudomonas alkylphenolica]RWU19123.1 hypothetical protein DM813_22665 [Pseudomonas alkylphenolica]
MTHTPFHHAQMVRTLPAWSKALHPDHASRIVQSLRKDYLDADGVAYPWYSKADTPTREALQRAIARRDNSRRALQTALSALQGVTEFCAPLLQRRLGLDIPVDQAQYVHQATKVEKPKGSPGGPAVPTEPGDIVADGAPQYRSLLEAALHNFEGAADTTRLSRLQRNRQDIRQIPGLTVADFIEHCRALDLGQRYQEHLDQVYGGESKDRLQRLASQVRRDAFGVQVRIAACKGQVNAPESLVLHGLCADDTSSPPVYEGRSLRCWQLLLLGVPIHEMLFIAPEENGRHDPVFLYNPADEDAIRGFASLADAYTHLRTQLLDSAYRKRFVALALQDQQADLKVRLMRELFSNPDEVSQKLLIPRGSIHLEVKEKALPVRPWASLESSHLVRLRADARTIAVPTVDVDAKVRLRNLEHWFDLGMTVLNVAAMVVPCLNPIMLTIGAAQIMGNVFEGISAWEEGDNAGALAQLESVLLNVVVVGAVVAGGAVFKASGFVDGMQSIIKDGKDYLWSGAMKDYSSPISLPEHLEADGLGRYTLEGRYFVRIDGELYEQVQENGRWRIAHPQDPQAYRPTVLDNGEGAWRGAHERPLEWDKRQLLRRLGPISEGLEDAELEAAMQCSGEQGDVLRQTQVAAQRPPALLADVIDRLRCTRQVDDIIDRVRHGKGLAAYRNFALPSLTTLDGWPEQHVIKAYTGPENWGESTLYGTADQPYPVQIEINRTELENGQLSERVVAQLDDNALNGLLPEDTELADQASALNDKLAQHLEQHRDALFERLYSRNQVALSPEAETLSRQFPGLPRRAVEQIMARISARERLRLASGRVPLRVAEEARTLQAQARLNKALLGLYRPELATADSTLLDTALKAEHPEADAPQRYKLAVGDRDHAAKLIGQQPIRPGYRSPMRLADGRLGYPLSGRRFWTRTADRRLRALYPSLGTRERNAVLGRLRQRGSVAAQLRALEIEQSTLNDTLQEWVEQGVAQDQQGGRSVISDQLNSAWRRDNPDTLTLEFVDIDALPSLPARFDHITTLNIHDIGIRQIPADFFQSFPSLRTLRLEQCPELDFEGMFRALEFTPQLEVLELGNNRLGALTGGMRQRLVGLNHLRRLSLRRNRLRLAEADLQTFAQLPLESLGMENNEIVLDATLAARFTGLRSLRDLRLTNNPLGLAPDLTGLSNLENLQLRNCNLQAWPRSLTELMEQADRQLRHLSLSYNPIDEVPDLDRILASPFVESLRTGRDNVSWDFNVNDLNTQSNRRLRAAGVEAQTDNELAGADDDYWLQDAGEAQQRLWQELFDGDANRYLRDVVERVARSRQAENNPDGLASQVWQLLEQAGQDQELRTHLDTVAQDYPPTCGDAGADGFSALELEALAFQTMSEEAERPAFLFNFFRGLYRREMVNALGERIQLARLARQARLLELERLPAETQPESLALPALDSLDILDDERLQRGGTDLIEIRLALRQLLAVPLEYPEASQGMLYRDAAMISSRVANNVEQAVLALDQTAAERRAWVARQSSWQRYLTQHFASQFKALDERWYQGMEYLDYCLNPESEAVDSLDDAVLRVIREVLPDVPQGEGGRVGRMELSDGAYDRAVRALNTGRDQARQALFEKLTGEQDYNN